MSSLKVVDDTTVTYRPKKIRWVAGPVAGAVVVLFTVLSFGLKGSAGFDNSGSFQRGDQAAMVGLGILIALGVLAFCRPRVIADADKIRIRNVVGGYDLPWSVVRKVRFDRNSPWAQLELHDEEQISIHALQAADKDYAVEGVRTLRRLHAQAVEA
ncbi:MAG TPA: PH domain-containing protein [Actinoplanes sp.]|nr:PH domain-containing protein [Actinoplanes sp.]